MDIIEYIGSIGGIAGVLAVLMFFVYRQDRKSMEDRLTGLTDDYNKMAQERTEALIKHTQVLSELITWLKAKNGHN